ncbi:RDD family protein [Actinoallomurus bryophytorum]|uniref:RDD family protein n=1 Tax=Actinoallomurus bryophytorum TaxID=1490222 RepID=A0A543CCF5_9ACTN|nr:RDD family protein [Actinoallomurus bryophytorum]TQL94759.1 RDD family protein [Actinoallomurus bryophytorum]
MSGPRRTTGSWLSGARAAGADLGYPGERMGLPEQGPGAVAGYGRRLAALVVDWLVALLIAQALSAALHWSPMVRSFVTLAVFGVIAWLATGIFGTTLGKRIAGLRVAGPDGGRVGLFWAFERTVLLVIVVPAVIWDRDHRGLHDRAANTVVVVR